MNRRYVLAASVATVAIALNPGCSSDNTKAPRVTLNADVSVGTHSSADCPDSQNGWLQIGSFGNPNLLQPDGTPANPGQPVDDGAPFAQGTASVNCTVTAQGNGFSVAASASLTGATGGSFVVRGFFVPGQDNSNISTSVTHIGTAYAQDGCTASFTTSYQGVDGGRVWAEVTCPNAQAPTVQRTCQTVTQFRFENCNQ
ncbi:MAG: hypothetical protein FWD73_05135 [Polyangiaceae bacterium]|nr:hypothetical protein [Polyangiaceae bacterium]